MVEKDSPIYFCRSKTSLLTNSENSKKLKNQGKNKKATEEDSEQTVKKPRVVDT